MFCITPVTTVPRDQLWRAGHRRLTVNRQPVSLRFQSQKEETTTEKEYGKATSKGRGFGEYCPSLNKRGNGGRARKFRLPPGSLAYRAGSQIQICLSTTHK